MTIVPLGVSERKRGEGVLLRWGRGERSVKTVREKWNEDRDRHSDRGRQTSSLKVDCLRGKEADKTRLLDVVLYIED